MNRVIEKSVKRTTHEERLTIRLSAIQSEKIDVLVEAGLYDTKVEFVRRAIEKLLPAELERADERTDKEFDYLNLRNKLQVLKDSRIQFEENRIREKDLLSR